jgi:hypothetical protein
MLAKSTRTHWQLWWVFQFWFNLLRYNSMWSIEPISECGKTGPDNVLATSSFPEA